VTQVFGPVLTSRIPHLPALLESKIGKSLGLEILPSFKIQKIPDTFELTRAGHHTQFQQLR
jgi:hypothetical protein